MSAVTASAWKTIAKCISEAGKGILAKRGCCMSVLSLMQQPCLLVLRKGRLKQEGGGFDIINGKYYNIQEVFLHSV